jgi:hypothetical protein
VAGWLDEEYPRRCSASDITPRSLCSQKSYHVVTCRGFLTWHEATAMWVRACQITADFSRAPAPTSPPAHQSLLLRLALPSPPGDALLTEPEPEPEPKRPRLPDIRTRHVKFQKSSNFNLTTRFPIARHPPRVRPPGVHSPLSLPARLSCSHQTSPQMQPAAR